MLPLEEMRELEREACRKDPVYFCETYCHIEDKDADELIQPFRLWDGQKKHWSCLLRTGLFAC